MKNKYERMTIWLRPDQIKILKSKEAKQRGLSASETIRTTLDYVWDETTKNYKEKKEV